MTRLSCHHFRSHEVRLWLSVLAYNLGNLWRRVLPQRIDHWSLTSLQQRLVKTGGRLIKHDREVKMEIQVYSAGNNGVYCVASHSWHRR